jgi:transposase
MSMGRRPEQRQADFWIALTDLPQSPGHVFYDKLNQLLADAAFDSWVESLCQTHYTDGSGRTSLPPGTYFRMLFVGYFEDLGSQRAIAWRCSDSLSLRAFLGIPLTESTPDHSSLTRIRQRLPLAVHEQVFTFVLKVAQEKHLLRGKTVAVDSTTLEANAAMRNIVRKDTGQDWNQYVKGLMAAEGIENPTDEEVRRFDQKRQDKKVSNQEWESPTDPDSRIAKMKDGRTHLAYKLEHTVDLDSEFVLAASVQPADQADSATLMTNVLHAQINLVQAGSEQEIEEVAADKGYHKVEKLAECEAWNTRPYIPEPHGKTYNWEDKPEEWREATEGNRQRVQGERSKQLQKKRSELVERSFAHVCETGGGRRSWLRGMSEVSKRYAVLVAAHNLGLLMRKLFRIGKPRTLQGGGGSFVGMIWGLYWGLVGHFSRRYGARAELCALQMV